MGKHSNELWTNSKCNSYIDKQHQDKLDYKATQKIFVGYGNRSKEERIDTEGRNVTISSGKFDYKFKY